MFALALELLLVACAAPPANELAAERSPYLLDHAADPVAWQPWGPEAFARAKAEDKPIFLSIGYASCRWCHVMHRESFQDPAIADHINRAYVAIKVDREERPDVDLAYLDAATLLMGSPGWPLTLVLTPDLEPVFAASYLPPRDGERGFARGLTTVLDDLAAQWRTDRAGMARHGREVSFRLQSAPPVAGGALPGPDAVQAGVAALVARYDPVNGGLGSGRRYPQWWKLELLARSDAGQGALRGTLDAIERGGLHDHVGGGFFRYTTDSAWRKPHFEKMLVDQAGAVDVWLAAGGNEPIVRETLDFVARELVLPGGGFAAALDAESLVDGQPVEGGYYLPGARDSRTPPRRDDSRVAGWNGRMIGAFARAGFALDEPRYVALAVTAADDLLRDLRLPDGTLARTDGGPRGLLDDQVLVVDGLLDLAAATGDPRWIAEALALQRAADAVFAAPGGGWWRTAADHHAPFGQDRGAADGAEPSAAGVGARAWIRLGAYGVDGGEASARRALEPLAATLADPGTAHAGILLALADLLEPPAEVVITWPDGADPSALVGVVRGERVVLRYPASKAEEVARIAPLAEGKLPIGGAPTAYVCHRGRCDAPTVEPAVLAGQLAGPETDERR